MKKRILSALGSLMVFCMVMGVSVINAEASEMKMVDGSYLTTDETSTGYSGPRTRGLYLMDGECSITKAGRNRVYAYASTTANQEVKYMATLVYVERYMEDVDAWEQVDWWMVEAQNDYYLSTAKTITVDRGYYYRVRANHIAGDVYPYEETASVTNGILVP
ncbi:MAG TPA: hypothetical protein H9798_07435 [Candidatus Mediterraneibacter pullicola]|uniref:Uncharacterized protein n=1 Tax=Candidatus Mediterraneibacter pullicola TaxID=2838682 RepID=A0A9D2HAJ8_9FIRM|nr:hypothetical protein [Candidatus Mediterraneibacter pullicola]